MVLKLKRLVKRKVGEERNKLKGYNMKHLLPILLILGLVGCTSEPPVTESPVVKEKVEIDPDTHLFGIVVIVCRSLDAMLRIMESDKISKEAATQSVMMHANMGVCGVVRPPQPGILEKLETSYIDYNGNEAQIWKLKGLELWTVVSVEHIDFNKKPKTKPNKTRPTGHTV